VRFFEKFSDLCYREGMGLFSVSVDLADRDTVVLSTAGEGLSAVEALAAAGAKVRWIDPEIPASFTSSARLEICRRSFCSGDLAGCLLAICGPLAESLRAQVCAEAAAGRVLLHCVGQRDSSSFHLPANLSVGPVTVSVDPGNASEALADRIRDEIAATLGPEFASAADYMATLQERFAKGTQRTQAFTHLLQSGLLEALRRGDPGRVERMTESVCRDLPRSADLEKGEV
jgi:precorrin-2 dehydrogenase/sirohydrochlorin ferrochelatase